MTSDSVRVADAPCRECGCTGIHACIGAPYSWTAEDKSRLDQAVARLRELEQAGPASAGPHDKE